MPKNETPSRGMDKLATKEQRRALDFEATQFRLKVRKQHWVGGWKPSNNKYAPKASVPGGARRRQEPA